MAVAEEIRAANERFCECVRRHDGGAAVALYTGGAKLLPPRSDFVQGADAIRKFWQAVTEAGIDDAKLETVDLETHGDTAIEMGTYVMSAGGNVADRGKYIVVWKNENGAWKLYRDIWNSSVAK